MARLVIRLLGAFQAFIDSRPIQNSESNKVRALLAYLVVENSKPHTREALTEMCWLGMPPRRGSSNLSQMLYNLNRDYGIQLLIRRNCCVLTNQSSSTLRAIFGWT